MSNPLIQPVGMYSVPQPSAADVSQPAMMMDESAGMTAIDGTPIRVVTLVFSAAVGLYALKLAGFRFNVGVSN